MNIRRSHNFFVKQKYECIFFHAKRRIFISVKMARSSDFRVVQQYNYNITRRCDMIALYRLAGVPSKCNIFFFFSSLSLFPFLFFVINNASPFGLLPDLFTVVVHTLILSNALSSDSAYSRKVIKFIYLLFVGFNTAPWKIFCNRIYTTKLLKL